MEQKVIIPMKDCLSEMLGWIWPLWAHDCIGGHAVDGEVICIIWECCDSAEIDVVD